MKDKLKKQYVKIKAMGKARFRLRETIDVRDMEIDDIKFEIDKIKTMSKMRIWNS